MQFLLTFLLVVLFSTAQGQDTIRWISKDLKKWTRNSTNPYLLNCLGSSIERKLYLVVERYHGDTLISQEETFNETCKVGTSKTFYKTGQLKRETNYLLQPENPKELTLCNMKEGKQLELRINGDTLIYENWSNGNFENEIKQKDSSTIWKFDCYLTSENIPVDSIKSNSPFEINAFILFRDNKKTRTTASLEMTYIIGRRPVRIKTFNFETEKLTIDHTSWNQIKDFLSKDGRFHIRLLENGKMKFYKNIYIKE